MHNYVRDVLYACLLGRRRVWWRVRRNGLRMCSSRATGRTDWAASLLTPRSTLALTCRVCAREPVLQPLHERCQLKMRRVMPAGLFVAPLVFSSTGVFLERSLRPLLTPSILRTFPRSGFWSDSPFIFFNNGL